MPHRRSSVFSRDACSQHDAIHDAVPPCVQGGGMDELTGLVIKSMRRGVDDSSVLPPIMRQMSTEQTAVATSAMRPRR
eukprot:366436-Chlamydomonas_euryale.AAC.26